MAATLVRRVLEETLQIHTNGTSEYEHVQTVSESPLWWVGVLLDAVATLAGTGGKQLLRHAAVSKNMWFYPLGLVCTAVIDPAFDISAYSFAAQSIIAPCAGMVVVWNVLLAPWTLGEKYTRPRLVGAALICFGTVLVGLFGNHTEVDRTVDEYLALFARPAAVAYYVLFAAWTVLCAVLYRRGSPFVRGFSVGALGGSLAGNMFTTKAVVEMLKCVAFNGDDATSGCTHNPFLTIFPYLFIAISLTLACVSLYMLAVGLRTFEALYMITVFEGFMIISGAISGNIVLNEKAGQPAEILWAYFASICIILFGLGVLCRGEHRNRQHAHDSMLDAVEMDDAGKEQFSALSSTTPSGPDGRRDSSDGPPGSAASSASGESNGHAQHIA